MSRVASVLIGCLAAAACVQRQDESARAAEPPGMCEVRVVVGFVNEPDAGVVADLARISGVRLEVIDGAIPKLPLFALRTEGPDSECLAAMERLRGDPRVSSVDVDTRRQPHAP